MKKNNMMRLASVLLVLVLLTTCAISGTFAKYTTSIITTDKARVAYWGWDAPAAALDFNLFDGEYDAVDAENSDNVVAPGTSKSAAFSFRYTPKSSEVNSLTAGEIVAPEVDYTFTIDFAVSTEAVADPATPASYAALDANPNFKWTLKKGDGAATPYNTVAELKEAVLLLSGHASGTMEYEAGNLPAAFTNADEVYTIGWNWAFETAGAGMTEQDIRDTAMGNAQNLDDITITITVSATQIDA